MDAKTHARTKVAMLESHLAAEMDRLAKLESRPEEPTTDDPDGAMVVWFRKQFNSSGTVFTYAAVKAAGAWYTTGPTGARFTWDQLLDFADGSQMWVTDGWDQVL